MKRLPCAPRALVFMAAIAVGLCGAAADSPCPITPAPKGYRDFGSSWPLAAGEQVAIVVGLPSTCQGRA